MTKIFGLLLMVVGVYFLSQDIIVTTHSSSYWWRWIPADLSILAIMGGVISLTFFQRQLGGFGWILLVIGVVLVFLSGGLILRGMPLWDFIVAFAAIGGGYSLMTTGRINI